MGISCAGRSVQRLFLEYDKRAVRLMMLGVYQPKCLHRPAQWRTPSSKPQSAHGHFRVANGPLSSVDMEGVADFLGEMYMSRGRVSHFADGGFVSPWAGRSCNIACSPVA